LTGCPNKEQDLTLISMSIPPIPTLSQEIWQTITNDLDDLKTVEVV